MTDEKNILVIGAGVSGVKCAFTLADLGYKVYLSDSQPYLGGKLSQLYKQFPTNDCGWCKMLPQFWNEGDTETCLRRNIVHKNMTLLPYTKVLSVEGEKDNFEVLFLRKTRFVDETKCMGCGECIEACEVDVPDDFNEKLTKRKAIWMRNSCPVPRVCTLDVENCTRCGKCVDVCPTKAIDLNMKDKEEKLIVGSIVLSSGYEQTMPELTEYGYGKYPNVLTNMELERMLSGDCTSIPPPNKSVGIIQCVGSRTEENDYCSYACCMYAIKEAVMLKTMFPDCQVTIFYMDMRTFGKEHYRYQKTAETLGVRLVRCRTPSVDYNGGEKLEVRWTDEGEIKKEEFDHVVLSIGQRVSEESKALAGILGLKTDRFGFIETETKKPVETSKPGIYACGSALGPKDIPDSVTEAIAVAAAISATYPPPELQEKRKEVIEETEPRIGLLLCTCGGVLSSAIDFDAISRKARGIKGLVHIEKFDLLCQQPERLKNTIQETGVTRVCIAACAPYQYKSLFEALLADCGIESAMLESLNIREECGLVHSKATGRVEREIRAALSKLYARDKKESKELDIVKRVLVVGGGVAGMSAACLISKHGLSVDIVEKEKELGGNLRHIHRTIEGIDVKKILSDSIKKIEAEPKIRVMKESMVSALSGSCGNFSAEIKSKGEQRERGIYGAIIIATGGREYRGREFSYGLDKRIMTQLEFENAVDSGQSFRKVVMIQCVGSRDEEHPYCCRVGCATAIKNALSLKRKEPESEIYILHRDIMTYGLLEKHYTDARREGINFVRFDGDKPEVKAGEELSVKVWDIVLNRALELKPDAVVLSTGIEPNEIKQIVKGLDLQISDDGFLKEASAKFRPVDTLKDGVFVCGLCHSPHNIAETITQALAAGIQAVSLLRAGKLRSRTMVSEVNERWCVGCGICVTSCPYNARLIDEEKNIAKVVEALCRGCGVCTVICPSESSRLIGYKRKGLMEMIDEIIET